MGFAARHSRTQYCETCTRRDLEETLQYTCKVVDGGGGVAQELTSTCRRLAQSCHKWLSYHHVTVDFCAATPSRLRDFSSNRPRRISLHSFSALVLFPFLFWPGYTLQCLSAVRCFALSNVTGKGTSRMLARQLSRIRGSGLPLTQHRPTLAPVRRKPLITAFFISYLHTYSDHLGYSNLWPAQRTPPPPKTRTPRPGTRGYPTTAMTTVSSRLLPTTWLRDQHN